jgi:DNA-directed RNA polymerase beta subunit
MVTITTMSEFVPHRGSKIVSGAQSADKGVISAILKPEEMPRDRTGRRADAVFGTESAFGRMTMGPVRELAYNSATESIIKHIKAASVECYIHLCFILMYSFSIFYKC